MYGELITALNNAIAIKPLTFPNGIVLRNFRPSKDIEDNGRIYLQWGKHEPNASKIVDFIVAFGKKVFGEKKCFLSTDTNHYSITLQNLSEDIAQYIDTIGATQQELRQQLDPLITAEEIQTASLSNIEQALQKLKLMIPESLTKYQVGTGYKYSMYGFDIIDEKTVRLTLALMTGDAKTGNNHLLEQLKTALDNFGVKTTIHVDSRGGLFDEKNDPYIDIEINNDFFDRLYSKYWISDVEKIKNFLNELMTFKQRGEQLLIENTSPAKKDTKNFRK